MKKQVLVVDDRPTVTRTVKTMLEYWRGYSVREENDPTNALSAALAFKPDLILLDIDMPEMDGGDIAREIHQQKDLRQTLVAFFTGLVTPQEAADYNAKGEEHVTLSKGLSLSDMMSAIDRLLQTAHA